MLKVSRKLNLFRLITPRSTQHIRRLALPPTRAEDTPHIKHNPYTREFPSTLTQVVHVLRRFLKFSLIGVFSLGSTTFLLFHGAHLYVEKISLAPGDYLSDPRAADIAQYEWDKELEDWTGSPGIGGTDPSLPWRARQAIRSAWMSLNWGSSVVSISNGDTLTPNDNRLMPALIYLNLALQASLDSQSRFALLELQGNVSSAISSMESLAFAGACYQAALEGVPANSFHAAKLHSRLAEVLNRLGRSGEALDAYWTSIGILGSSKFAKGKVPTQFPISPSASRLLLRNLAAVSASYASSVDHKTTFAFQLASLALTSHMDFASDVNDLPGQLLHRLYVQQRAATIRLHLAEIQYAMDQQARGPLQHLSEAATISEHVALTLSRADNATLEHPGSPPVLSPTATFTSNNALSQPSRSLLLDASRSAAAAYHLSAILHEKQGRKGYHEAVRCLERALRWCGGVEGPSANIPLTEWQTVWADYKRLRALAYPTCPV